MSERGRHVAVILLAASLALSSKDHIHTAMATAAALVYGLAGPHLSVWSFGARAALQVVVLAIDYDSPSIHSPLVCLACVYL